MGQTYPVCDPEVHSGRQHHNGECLMVQQLPICDGNNGQVGLDCRARPAPASLMQLERPNDVYNYPFVSEPCTGKNGEKMQDCTVTRHKDQNPVCSGAPGEQPSRNCIPKANYFPTATYITPALAQLERPNDVYNYPFVAEPCTGKNGENMQDCTVTRHKD